MAIADNSQFLRAAQQRRREALIERTRQAVRNLDQAGQEISFVAVAEAAQVSRAFLYKNPELAHQIQQLRDRRRPSTSILPAAQRMSDASKDARAKQLLADNRALRAENQHLKEQVAALLGSLREARIPT